MSGIVKVIVVAILIAMRLTSVFFPLAAQYNNDFTARNVHCEVFDELLQCSGNGGIMKFGNFA